MQPCWHQTGECFVTAGAAIQQRLTNEKDRFGNGFSYNNIVFSSVVFFMRLCCKVGNLYIM